MRTSQISGETVGLFNMHDYEKEARMQRLLDRTGPSIFHDEEDEALIERMIEDGLIPDPHEKPAEKKPESKKKKGSAKNPKTPKGESE